MVDEIKSAGAAYSLAFRRWWDVAVEMMIINIVGALACLTVVLAPFAIFGMWYTASVMLYGEDYGIGRAFSLFWEGIRKYWLNALKWFVVNIIILVVLIVNIIYYGKMDEFWAVILRSFFVVMTIIWGMIQMYTVPYLFEQNDKRLRVAIKNGCFTMLAAPVFSLLICGGIYVLAIVCLGLFVPSFLGGIPLLGFLSSAAVLNRIKKYKLR